MRSRIAFVLAAGSVLVAASLSVRIARTATPDEMLEEGEDANERDDEADSSAAPATPSPPPPPLSADGMVSIAAATFHMGSTAPKSEPNEGPVHAVSVSTFWIDANEVTVAAYRTCVNEHRCAVPLSRSSDCTWTKSDDRLPMSCVSHDEAVTFCGAKKKRLPTEAEWELAARGTSDRRYPWGDESPDCDRAVTMKGNFTAESCGDHGPLAIGGRDHGRSRAGVFDLAGNLEEWVGDYYDDRYPDSAQKDPRGPSVGTAFVLRGGGWLSPRFAARATARSWGSMEERGANVGFRCARDGTK